MKEEQVTKAILKWLINNRWTIVCFDFPQSGTGRSLHPNKRNDTKNRASIIPDIVAVRDGTCVFFENKDRFYLPDYEKQSMLIKGNDYSDAISALLAPFDVRRLYYGIGFPSIKYTKSSEDATHLIDFLICVNEDKSISIPYNPHNICFQF